MKKTKSRWRSARHLERRSRHAIRWAGPRTAVAKALGKSLSAVSHEANDRANPDVLVLLKALTECTETTARSFAEAVAEVVELREIIEARDAVLIERGLYLMDRENESCAHEDRAALLGVTEHAESLRRHGSDVLELASILDELAFRGVDLHALYRAKAAA